MSLSADNETSNVLKRSVKNVRSRFGSLLYIKIQRWSRGHKARGQGQGHKKIRGPEDRTSRGQGQECSRLRRRTQAQAGLPETFYHFQPKATLKPTNSTLNKPKHEESSIQYISITLIFLGASAT